MNLEDYKFPKVDAVDMAFSTFKTLPDLKAEAEKNGFDSHYNKWNKRFNTLFYSGGKLNLKEGYNEEMLSYLKCFMRSWEPKHEEKEMICAMLLSELEDEPC